MYYFFEFWAISSLILFFKNRYIQKKWLNKRFSSIHSRPDKINFFFDGFVFSIVFILLFIIYKLNTTKFNTEYKDVNTTIFSLNNQTGGTFVLGTGNIENDYTTYISENGGYKKQAISSDALIKEDLNNSKTGILSYKMCQSEEILDFNTLNKMKTDGCISFSTIQKKDVVIHVPKGTIIKDFKI
jgi:hypothetical protein